MHTQRYIRGTVNNEAPAVRWIAGILITLQCRAIGRIIQGVVVYRNIAIHPVIVLIIISAKVGFEGE